MEDQPDSQIGRYEKPIDIEIRYGIDIDADRLKSTIDRLPWYIENGYIHIKIPEGLSESSTKEDVASFVSSNYSEGKYKEIANKISESWPQFSASFEELRKIPDFHFGNTYKVYLTGYGVGGSYHADTSEIFIDAGTGDMERIMKMMAHEIVHTGIEYLIRKYKVAHWKKERLVDLICENFLPKENKMFARKSEMWTMPSANIGRMWKQSQR